MAICNPAVAFATATAYFDPQYLAANFSNSRVLLP
jgi:hypothetical protein